MLFGTVTHLNSEFKYGWLRVSLPTAQVNAHSIYLVKMRCCFACRWMCVINGVPKVHDRPFIVINGALNVLGWPLVLTSTVFSTTNVSHTFCHQWRCLPFMLSSTSLLTTKILNSLFINGVSQRPIQLAQEGRHQRPLKHHCWQKRRPFGVPLMSTLVVYLQRLRNYKTTSTTPKTVRCRSTTLDWLAVFTYMLQKTV